MYGWLLFRTLRLFLVYLRHSRVLRKPSPIKENRIKYLTRLDVRSEKIRNSTLKGPITSLKWIFLNAKCWKSVDFFSIECRKIYK